ncbi:amino acid adenylation domain-containing protein [Frankia sp. AgPm24]|uniref:non-ribosomal peptide synthetase n=1 Tax=Frankia sp. AgPm24 TaxID=631128 RepID=UPI00200EACA6|nr:non-ribosomal peptide synthetase [Frankia sp. AgPm24]MCK9922450.1 amino acid adenylation domain-containing protein [Frankia sp. AgPm24]
MSTGEIEQGAALRSLRDELLRHRLRGGSRRGAEIPRADRSESLPLSHGQQQMWFLDRLDPGSAEYLVPFAFRLRGPLDQRALRGAWAELIARHEILRTRYGFDGAEPVQIIDDGADFDLPVVEESPDRLADIVAGEAVTPFDLERDRPVRARLFRLAPDDHLLTIVFHHIAFDAWSTRVVGAELRAFYRAFTMGEAARLPASPFQYADYAAWQRAQMSGDRLAGHLDYWHRQLAGLPSVDLPADRSRPALRSSHGAMVSFAFPGALASGIRDLAARQETTPFVVLLTAFQILLARYTGQSDIPVGTVVSGRTRPELQELIGYCINNLVLRARWDGDPTFRDLLLNAHGTLVDAYDHQAVPFARLVDELQPERDMSRSPLYQVAFTLHQRGGAILDLPGLAVEPYPATGEVAKCDLELQIDDAPDGAFDGQFVYATSLLEADTVRRLAGHFIRLLEAAVADSDATVSQLDLLDGAERSLVTGGAPRVEPVPAGLQELFEAQVVRTPDAAAVVADGVTSSYREVNGRANRLAHRLRRLGAGPETLVGVHLDPGAELIPTLLGVLKSGAGYVPLDPVNPPDRLGYVLADANVSLVVTDSARASSLVGLFEGRLVVLDAPETALGDESESDPLSVSSPDNVAYVIYTSGSTGRPKGVCVSHANVVRLMRTADEHYGFTDSDVWTLAHSFAFDVSVFEMWGALLHGGALVIVPRMVTRSPDEFLDLLVEHRVTMLSQTPSAFRSLTVAAADGDHRLGRLALRAVIFAGERLEIPELKPWIERLGAERPVLANMYGITETTVHTTYHRIGLTDVTGGGNPVGRPLADLSVRLLDGSGGLSPLGVPGEIHVAGAGVARGYLNRPELTAERFVPDPFGPPGSRQYRSGDLARRRPDGSLDFLGRADDQVKIRGYRIELGEIEVTLATHPLVRSAVIVAREDIPGDRRLVAYVVSSDGSAPEPAELRELLGRTLPEYMVPASFVTLTSIPLTVNGKLDRRALPAPDPESFSRGDYVAPRTPTEERVALVWAEALGVDRVGVYDGFFELGGDSMRAVALVGVLRAEGYDLSVRDVFDRRSVAELCELLAERSESSVPEVTLVAPFALISAADRAKLPDGVVDAYPMTQIQTGMVIEMLDEDGDNTYHNCSSFRILDDQPFSSRAFERAARLVVARHEALRTSLHLTDYSVPMQLVHASAEVSVGVHDIGGLPGGEQLPALREFVRRERATAFDLSVPALMRFHAHHSGEGGWWISITECHPIMEGWSYHSLFMELLGAYRRIRDGLEPEPYQAPAVRFADSVAAELVALRTEADADHWRGVVQRYPKFTLPDGWGEPDGPRTMSHVRISWADLETDLRALAIAADASLKSVLLAAFLKVLSQLTDAAEFHAGLVYDVRPEVLGADRVYGMYLNTLPVPFERSATTWLDLVRQVFAREIGSWPHRRFPLPAVQRLLGEPQRLVDVFFNYQDFRQVDRELVDSVVGIDDSPTEFPLTVSARAGHVFLTADSRALTRTNTERIATMFRAVLAAMAADPQGSARTTFLADDERERLLGDWAVNPATPVARSVCELFEDQAALTPDAIAVVAEDTEVTYAVLEARANQCAHHLRSLGARPESVVGVLLDRGVDLLVALLGTWKAGAAYLPIDPAFPAVRVAQMLADADTAVLVTRSSYRSDLDFDGPSVLVDTDRAALDSWPSVPPPRAADLDHLAYIIYTSGSTGRPKGVQIPHRGLVNHVQWAVDELASRGDGGAPLFSSIAFDLVVPNLWAPLLAGQAVHMVPQDTDLAELGSYLARRAPYSFIKLTPAHLEVLTHQLPAEQADGLAAVLVVAGEALTRRVVRDWSALAPSVPILNEYGPTEASVGTCTFAVISAAGAEVAPIGQPLPNVTMYVLDEYLEPVPPGAPGELYVGGAGLARGYAGRPELTARRFVPDPHGVPGGRLYRTGDRVRMGADGNVDFLGRADDQIKIRGYRVELGEIESVIEGWAGVEEVRVVPRTDSSGAGQLVAYLVPAAGHVVDETALREQLAQELPGYMVPSAFVALDSMPLTANGKLDRRALPDPGGSALAGPVKVAPRTLAQQRVAAAWRVVLGVDAVGVHDEFFEAGGDSIRAVALVGAVRASGLDISVRDVFRHRSVAALAKLAAERSELSGEQLSARPFELMPAEDRVGLPAGVVDAYPLSQVQTGMLVEMLADESRSYYHNVNVYEVHDDAPFDPAAFSHAVRVMVARHEVLRTSVHLTGYSVPLQLVHEQGAVPIAWADIRDLDEKRQRAVVTEFVAAERADVFDLSGPLLRVFAHLRGDREWLCSFTQNHAVMDGWSNQLLLMDLIGCYRRVRDGLEPQAWSEPALRYADVIAAELASLESAQDSAYWQSVVRDHAKFTLPAGWHGDLEQPPEIVRTGTTFEDLEEGLRALAAAARTSMKSVLVAAHLKVMSQLTDEPEFHTGVVTHTRPEADGADRIYGNFLNTLPFPADRSAATWRHLVRQVADREAEAWPHRRYPMPAIRHAPGGRLVDVFFSYLDFHRLDSEIADDSWGFNDAPNEFALRVTALRGILSLSSSTHVLSAANADRIAGMFRAVLAAMAADVDGDARETCLPDGEREWLLGLDPGTDAHPVAESLHELFEAQVSRVPEATAVVADGVRLSYAEVNGRADGLTRRLRDMGVGAESLVGVCLERGPDLVPTLLGVLKSGAGYLPLDPGLPPERLGYMLTDAGVSVVVTGPEQRSLLADLFDGELVVVGLDPPAVVGSAPPPGGEPARSDADNVAYVIYTSGSTGRPKGVSVSHANVVRLLRRASEHYRFTDSDVWSLFHAATFDVSVFEMWGALLHGGTLVVVPREVTRSPEEFLDLLIEHRVTVLSQTPSAFRSLTAAAEAGDPRLARLGLRMVLFAGERLEPSDLHPWVDRLGLDHPVLVNLYGITETTVHVTHHEIMRADLEPRSASLIGRALDDLRVHLLDGHGRLVPLGVPGEVHVGGPGLSRGYLNRPELTAQRFVPDPFGPPGARLYRSGDLARRRPDGRLEFVGRRDDQVKIRGYRIEPGEVESVLAAHPRLRSVAVVSRDDAHGARMLVAYYVAVGDPPPTPTDLTDYCRRELPDYMVPSAFVPMESNPLTANGKLDLRALPAPDREAYARTDYVSPRSPLQERIAAVWQAVLGLDRLGVHDGFFEVGGDSIKAVRLVGALRASGIDVAVRDVLDRRTVAGLSDLLEGRTRLADADRLVEPFTLLSAAERDRLPGSVADAYPMSQVQIGMVVEMLTGANAYRSFVSYRVSDDRPFAEDALRRAARIVIDRHDLLRTSFDLHSYSVPMQIVHTGVDPLVVVHDVRGDREALMRRLAEERDAPFDLGAASLLRVAAHLDGDRSWWLSISRPHAITEGWSHSWLLAELMGCYRRLRDGLDPEPYEPPGPRFADHIAAELRSLGSAEDSVYWRHIVDTHAPVALPDAWGDGPGADAGSVEYYDLLVPLDDVEEALRALAARLHVSVKSVLLAAHVKVMSQLTEAHAFHVGLVCDARPEIHGADRVYGMHLNTVPFPATRTARTWRELVQQVFDQEVGLWPHRRYPFPATQRWHRERLLNVVFNYVDLPDAATESIDTTSRFGVSQTEFDLTLHCRRNRLNLTTSTRVLGRASGERLAGMYRAVLAAMLADADGDARATRLPDGERERLLPAAAPVEPAGIDVPAEFGRRARETPAAVAVVDSGGEVTYAELDARAERLARHLSGLEVGPEVLVAIRLERSAELVLAVLAVLRTGGAYLPLDPEMPTERLAFVLADARPRILLTRQGLEVEGIETIALDGWEAAAGGPALAPADSSAPPAGPDSAATSDQLAYVIYTSGSTGTPKGAMVHRGGMGNHLLAKIEDFGLTAADSVVQNASPAFDISVWQMLAALVVGGRVRAVDPDTALDPTALFEIVAAEGISVLEVVPSLLRAGLDVWDTDAPVAELPALRRLVVTGETLPPELCARWFQRFPNIPIVNAYGPTECSDDVTHAELTSAVGAGRVPIGTPIRNTALYVLDEWSEPVPAGVPGELHVGGVGVGRGYLDRPELSAERFVPDPYGPPGARMYRTGDLASWRSDGALDFLGRLDDQVKVRGHRVEPGEIEAALGAHPQVGQAVVVVRDEQLIAYLTAAGERPAPEALRVWLARTLPEYMLPAAYVAMDAIPLTPNGKLDRRALPEPDETSFTAGEYVAPRTPLESRVADIWREVLRLERVGVRESFFDLGGDSIRAVALVGAMRADGVDVAVRDVFEARTVERLCELVADRAPNTGDVLVAPFGLISPEDRATLPAGVVDAYPLGRTQLGMIIELLADPERSPYHIINTFRVTDGEPLVPEALQAAVTGLVDRHEVLRTSVRLHGFSQPLQLVHDTTELVVDLRNVRGRSEEELGRIRQELIEEQRATGFDLERAPLLRIIAHVESDDAWWVTFTQTHVITEGWSYHLLLEELLDLYQQIRSGRREEPYERPRVRFADTIAAELRSLASEEDRSYWRRVVADHEPVAVPAELAGDSDDPVYVPVPFEDLGADLRALASTVGVSFKSVLLAAHLKVMGQLTDRTAYHTGLVCDTRPEILGADRVLGMYVNTLPIAVDRRARTWRELLVQVFDREVELWAHRYHPMPVIQHEWGGGRLMTVMFNYLDFHQVDTGRVAAGTRTNVGPNEFALSVFNRGDTLWVNSNERVLSQANAERLAGMYRAVLEAMTVDPDGDARAVYLPAGERERLLEQATRATPHGTVSRCVHELFEEQVHRTPDAVAVISDGEPRTYAEVNAAANRLAHRLRNLGAGPESVVGVCLLPGSWLMPALLGVLKAGAAYLPLDPSNPAERSSFMLADSGVSVVVADAVRAAAIERVHDGEVVVLDEELPATVPDTDPAPLGDPDNLIYVIYTSGSTGRPKGVGVSHANVVRLMDVAQEHYAFDESDVWALSHTYAFDVSVFEMWGALLHGGTLVTVPRAVTRSPEDFLDLLVEHQVTMLCQTPSAFRALSGIIAGGDSRAARLALRAIVFAGEKLETAELRPWADRIGLGRVALTNMYGPTETTVYTTYHRYSRRDFAAGAGSPIGRPLADLSTYLLDGFGNLAPLGVPGELHVGGPGVTRGYLNRPELTAERFVPDPFGPAGSRLYRTGDLTRRRPDGVLEFLGRVDDQIKIRGYRVELGEIEAALSLHPGVRETVVIARAGDSGDRSLVAYVVPAAAEEPDPAALRSWLGQTLPDYMIPAAYQVIDRVPLTANGKLDRRALPAPGRSAFARQRYVPAATPLEEQLVAAWQAVLGVEQIGTSDGFFDLGGDSIRAVMISGRLRVAGVDVTARDLLEHQTVAAVCAVLPGRSGAAHDRAVAPFELLGEADRGRLPATGIVDAYPLSRTQTGMLVEMMAGDGPPRYHRVASMAVGAAEPFSAGALERALAEIVARHEVLRTSVDLATFSVPMQLVHARAQVPLRVVELAGDEDLRAFVEAESRVVVPPESAPMLRVCAHTADDGSWRLTITISHLIVDGWTFSMLRTELLELYRAFRDGGLVPPHNPPDIRYADVVAAELRALESPADRDHWRGLVAGRARFELPGGWGGDSGTYQLRVEVNDLTDGLRALATAAGASVKSVLLAAHLKVLSQLTRERRFFTGVVTHTRPDTVGADEVYGLHLNTLPFPADMSASTWRDLVRQVFAEELRAWPHRHFPMAAIQHEIAEVDRLVDTRFSYQDFGLSGADVAAGGSSGSSLTEFPLAVSTAEGGLVLTIDGRVLDQARGKWLARLYRTVLMAMAADGEGEARATLLSGPERDQLAGDWAGNPGPAVTRSVVELFEEQAAASPDAVAVRAAGTSRSYADLDACANGYARHLRDLGVGPESVVGVLLDRGADLIAWLLGVWKAGGAYLPLEPSHPDQRISYMIEDVRADVVITNSRHTGRFGAGFTGTLVRVDMVEQAPAPPFGAAPDLDSLAYVIYTSGSTGRPKGAQVTHRGLANHLRWAVDELAARGSTGAPLFSSIAFDLVVPNLWAPLLAGQPVTVLDPDLGLDLLGERLVASGPYSFIKLTPGHLDILTAQLSAAQAADLASVVVVAGEALPPRTVDRWRALAPGAVLINEYGPTEATVGTCVHPLDDRPGGAVVPIGRPLPNMTAYVLNDRMDLMPAGVAGELYVGGAGVARGYAGRPELTAARFVPDPFGPPGSRLYRSGDLVRRRADGDLEFQGRIDRQVKVRGYRVELGEIEAVLDAHPSVTATRVTVREDTPGDQRLAAYVVLATGAGDPEDLRPWLGEQLPHHMVPASLVALDAMPLTANGKVDERRLPRPSAQAGGAGATPRTPVERALRDLWTRMLGLPDLDTSDSFFDIGGQSIIAIRMVAEARAAGLELTLFMLYQHRTLGRVAAAIDAAAAATESEGTTRDAVPPDGAVTRPRAVPSEAPGRVLPSPASAMADARTPGASVALIGGGELLAVESFGSLAAGGGDPVTPETVFQVGSMSKHVTAFGMLRLVDDGVLDLDEDVNVYLRGWRVPEGRHASPVTIRQLLGHRSGLTPNEGKGYRPGAVPTLLDLLHGLAPATNAPVVGELVPGAVFRKANVHFSVLQQVMVDVTGEQFPDLMRALVFAPLGMGGSDFDQAFPERTDRPVARGHHADGTPVEDGWLRRPDMAAAGLWTTAADIARLTQEIRRSWLGRPFARLSQELARAMLTPDPDSSYGLGTVVDGSGAEPTFGHGGSPVGYHALATCRLRSGAGWVVLTNGFAGQDVVRVFLDSAVHVGRGG